MGNQGPNLLASNKGVATSSIGIAQAFRVYKVNGSSKRARPCRTKVGGEGIAE